MPSELPTAAPQSFFRLLELDAGEVDAYGGALDRILNGDIHGLVVHNLYEPQVLAGMVARLERHDPPFLKTWFPGPFKSWFYGQNLNLAEPGLPGYFQEAARFNAQLETLFPKGRGLTDYIAGILQTLDGGRPFVAPPGPQPDQRYMFTTLRAHLEGGFIPPHWDNEQALRPSYRHLLRQIQPHLLSFVLAFSRAEGGGALQIYDSVMAPVASAVINDDHSGPQIDVTSLPSVDFRLPPGSMIVMDSGRYLHRVTPVEGTTKRWTACSFMALSRDGDAMYCWG